MQIVKIYSSFLKLGVETKLKQVHVRFDKTDLLIISEFELGNDQNTHIFVALDNEGDYNDCYCLVDAYALESLP